MSFFWLCCFQWSDVFDAITSLPDLLLVVRIHPPVVERLFCTSFITVWSTSCPSLSLSLSLGLTQPTCQIGTFDNQPIDFKRKGFNLQQLPENSLGLCYGNRTVHLWYIFRASVKWRLDEQSSSEKEREGTKRRDLHWADSLRNILEPELWAAVKCFRRAFPASR